MNYEREPVVMEDTPEIRAPENMFLGMVGAVAGALIGGASIVLFSQMGYIASISGMILAFCTLKGYELLARGISRGGVVFCAILMLLTPFAADWVDWAIYLMGYGLTFGEGMMAFVDLLLNGGIDMSEYLKNLGMIYLFAVLGGFYTVRDALKRNMI